MTIQEVEQLGLKHNDRIILQTWIIETSNDTGKATFISIDQPDKRTKKYNLVVRFYKCQNLTNINIDDITSIKKGWEE